jgi:hypothetical protein
LFSHSSFLALEEVYAVELRQLQDMGFYDTQANIRALQSTNGNVNLAIEVCDQENKDRKERRKI